MIIPLDFTIRLTVFGRFMPRWLHKTQWDYAFPNIKPERMTNLSPFATVISL
jgi:hypothetical protein